MYFSGRTTERARIIEALSSGREDLLLVVGAQGIGKTSLLESVAAEVGTTVVTFAPQEADWAYSGLSAIAAGLGGWRAGAIDAVLQLDRTASDDAFTVAVELSRALRSESGAVPLLLDGLDDLDSASASVLAFLLARRQGTGLRIAAAATSITASGPFGGFRQMRLQPLTRAEAVHLASARFGSIAKPGVLAIVAIQAGGNPGAIVNAVLSGRELAGLDAVRIPLRADATVGVEWDAVGSSTSLGADLLRMLAIAPMSLPEALVGDVAARADALEDLLESGLVEANGDAVRIVDRQFRSAVHASLDAQERRSLHLTAVEAHEAIDPRIALWHRSFVHPLADTELSLLTVAEVFAREGDVATAIEFAERSVALHAGLPERGELLLRLAEALVVRGDYTLAGHYLHKIDGHDRTDDIALRRATASLRVAASLAQSISERGVDSFVNRHALDRPEACASLLLTLAHLHLARWDAPRATGALRRARVLTSKPSGLSFGLISEVLLSEPRVSGAHSMSRTVSRTDEALGAIELLQPLNALLLLRTLVMGGRYEEARDAATKILDRVPPLGPTHVESVHALIVLLEVRAGRSEFAAEALTAWRAVVLPEPALDAVRCFIDSAAASAVEPAPSSRVDALIAHANARCQLEHNTVVPRHLAVLEGGRALAHGRYDDAVRLLRQGISPGPDSDPATFRADADLIEALWLAGRQADARAKLSVFAQRVARWPGAWSGNALARASAVCADEASGVGFARAFNRSDASTDDLARLRAAQARAADASDEPRALPASTASPVLDLLDSNELEVASLVQSGLRNREIAAALFVSQRTVELRLTRIYRKLAIDSRAHLVALMSGLH